MCGHTIKSSLINELSVNTLDDNSIPSSGMKLTFSQELAGIGLGNVAFFKTFANGGYFKEVAKNLVLGLTFGAGNISHITTLEENSVRSNGGLPCDKFHIGKSIFNSNFCH